MTRKNTRIIVAVIMVAVAAGGCSQLMSSYLKAPRPTHRVKVEKNVMVTMRDGTRLATDIYRPAGVDGPLPVVMTRLPYNKDLVGVVGKMLAGEGYIYVIQDCRACFHSEGDVFIPMVYEREDGQDTIAWIAQQPWFNGSLATWGPSYLGITQWAVADSPYLKCMYPQITTGRLDEAIFSGGAFHFRLASGWSAGVGKQHGNQSLLDTTTDKVDPKTQGFYNAPLSPELPIKFTELRGLSVADLQKKMAQAMGLPEGQTPPNFVEKMMEMMNYPAFAENAEAFNFRHYDQVKAPMLLVGGWYDIFIKAQLDDFVALRNVGTEAGLNTKIIIGPWGHVSGFRKDAGRDAKKSAILRDFFLMDWYEHWLKGVSNGIENAAPVKLYVMGKNTWREEREWPLARTRYTNYYLHGGGRANGVKGDGALAPEAPGAEAADRYTYDPRDPVPTAGGNNLLEDVGAKDQKAVEARPDVLIYTTAPLTEDLEVTGPITLVLYAQSSAVDTDFVAKLCDVAPNGVSLNLSQGAVRARYRDSLSEPSLLEPGKIYEYKIELWPTSNLFRKGHRVRLQLTSSSFPLYDRNTNAGGQGGPANIVVADQTVLHDREHASHLVLPIIP
jgi:uncharacterized protein